MVTTTQLNYSTPETRCIPHVYRYSSTILSLTSFHSLSVVVDQRQELEDYERITDDQIMNEVEVFQPFSADDSIFVLV